MNENDTSDIGNISNRDHEIFEPVERKCHACKSVLNDGATKCGDCGSHQGSRKWLNYVNEIISPISTAIGLISVAAASWLFIAQPSGAKIHGVYLDDGESLTFLLENQGKSAAVLLDASVEIPKGKEKRVRSTNLTITNVEDRVIESKEVTEIRFFDLEYLVTEGEGTPLEEIYIETYSNFDEEEICILILGFGEVNEDQSFVEIKFPCVDLATTVGF